MKERYWNHTGKYEVFNQLLHTLIPAEGPVGKHHKNKALEKFRKASNCYYDLYNNGLCNYAIQFAKVFGIPSSHYKHLGRYPTFSDRLYELTEVEMDKIILEAMLEQTPNIQNELYNLRKTQ